jgi:hypothetical protein
MGGDFTDEMVIDRKKRRLTLGYVLGQSPALRALPLTLRIDMTRTTGRIWRTNDPAITQTDSYPG